MQEYKKYMTLIEVGDRTMPEVKRIRAAIFLLWSG
jgi:hypothetical protein